MAGKVTAAEVGSEVSGEIEIVLPPVSRVVPKSTVLGRIEYESPMVRFSPETKLTPLMAPTPVTNRKLISSSIDDSPSIEILLSSGVLKITFVTSQKLMKKQEALMRLNLQKLQENCLTHH